MVTGDHPITAKAIARSVGIISAGSKTVQVSIVVLAEQFLFQTHGQNFLQTLPQIYLTIIHPG
jgi:magnesium-transporting ATPase (P-type)